MKKIKKKPKILLRIPFTFAEQYNITFNYVSNFKNKF